eukprot:m51a1_g11210 hypothetical protein (199) ;mRNA; r:39011-39607
MAGAGSVLACSGELGGAYATETGLVGAELGLVERACRGEELGSSAWAALAELLTTRPVLNVERALDHVYTQLRAAATGRKRPFVRLSKHYVDFGYGPGTLCPLAQMVADEVRVESAGKDCSKAKFRVVYALDCAGAANITAAPHEGVVKKRAPVSVAFRLTALRQAPITQIAALQVDGGPRYLLIINVDSRPLDARGS